MKLILDNKQQVYTNAEQSVIEMFNYINNYIGSTQQLFSHLIIDGIEIYDNHFDYINQQLENIDTIEVVILTTKQYEEQLKNDSQTVTETCLQQSEQLAVTLYQHGNDDQWQGLLQLAEQVLNLTQIGRQQIQLWENQNKNLAEYKTYKESMAWLQVAVNGFDNAIQRNDAISVADGVWHEIMPQLHRLEAQNI